MQHVVAARKKYSNPKENLIGCWGYAPTAAATGETKGRLHGEITRECRKIDQHFFAIVGHVNTRIRVRQNGEAPFIGQFPIGSQAELNNATEETADIRARLMARPREYAATAHSGRFEKPATL